MTSKTINIGILGGGQLAKLLIQESQNLPPTHPILFHVLDPNPTCPASLILPQKQFICGALSDVESVKELVWRSELIIFENEHIPCDLLERCISEKVEKGGIVKCTPSLKTMRMIQNKYLQKCTFKEYCAPFQNITQTTKEEMIKEIEQIGMQYGYPLMMKQKYDGYDGKGNLKITHPSSIPEALSAIHSKEVYIEKWVGFDKELSVICCKSSDNGGDVFYYEITETIQVDSICQYTLTPANIPSSIKQKILQMSKEILERMEGNGVYGIEYFYCSHTGDVYLNEVAPRVHNSGHYTLQYYTHSQFLMHLYSVLDLPLPKPKRLFEYALMMNMIGRSEGVGGMGELQRVMHRASMVDGVSVYWYGKRECRRGRKMGHLTYVGDSLFPIQEQIPSLLEEYNQTIMDLLPPLPKFEPSPLVLVVMGSDSDLQYLKPGLHYLTKLQIPFLTTIISAHRTPRRLFEYTQECVPPSVRVVIAAAGGAAHLPGMFASLTPLPVIGVPILSSSPTNQSGVNGLDSLLSIVQMPKGIPVATVSLNGGLNAAILASRILGCMYDWVRERVEGYMKEMEGEVLRKVERMAEDGWEGYEYRG